MSKVGICLGLCLSTLAPVVSASEGEEAQYSLEAKLVNRPGKAQGGKGGAQATLSGKAKGFPTGTMLHVSILVRDALSDGPVQADFFQIRLEKGSFSAKKVYKQQAFAPLSYAVRVEMILSQQRKARRDWIRREYGLPKDARMHLVTRLVSVGSPKEQLAFRKATMLELKGLVERFEGDRKALAKVLSKKKSAHADWAAAKKAITTRVRASQDAYVSLKSRYVAWHEKRVMDQLYNGNSSMFSALRYYEKKREKRARRGLKRVKRGFRSALSDLNSRLPKKGKQ